MRRAKTYQVRDNRIRYICDHCDAKRSLPVPPHLRIRSIICHQCGTKAKCHLNRRQHTREQQSGKAIMMLNTGREVDIDLQDISPAGVGVDVKPGGSRMLRLQDEVKFKCGWNPNLFANGRFIIKSIKGSRIGIQNVAYRVL